MSSPLLCKVCGQVGFTVCMWCLHYAIVYVAGRQHWWQIWMCGLDDVMSFHLTSIKRLAGCNPSFL